MALTDDDIREILRLIDESQLDELRLETSEFSLHVVRGGASAAEPAPTPAPAAPALQVSADGVETIEAPMPGTFYRAEGPGMEPFVDVGAQVEPDTVVGILEVMKMMNSIQAGLSGTIVEICAEDAQLLREGAPLFKVAPIA
jgi:acetyl-CoA carboxylase biotin carboxyl carrier protein